MGILQARSWTGVDQLTGLEESLSRLVNVHARCIEKEGKVVFLHRIEPGRADRSYGIHVAERAGLTVKGSSRLHLRRNRSFGLSSLAPRRRRRRGWS